MRTEPDPPKRPLADLAGDIGTHLLLTESEIGLKRGIDGVFCSLQADFLGPAAAPLSELATNVPEGVWRGADGSLARALNRRVSKAAELRLRDPARKGDYNGTLASLRDWRLERSDASMASQLHLVVRPTSFAYLVATSGNLSLQTNELDGEPIRDLCLDRHLDAERRQEAQAASALAVHLNLLTKDGMMFLADRSSSAEWQPGKVNTAANGAVEITPRPGLEGADLDSSGLLDVRAAAVREAHEEVGSHLDLVAGDLTVVALALDFGADQVTPYVVCEARSALTFEDIASGHFSSASASEGAFEVGPHFVGLGLAAHTPGEWAAWARQQRTALTRPAITALLLTQARRTTWEEVERGWQTGAPPADPAVRTVPSFPGAG